MNKNGTMWLDTDGNPIQAHGGMIEKFDGIYYWYGENKAGETVLKENGLHRVDFIGFSCYSSADCISWKNEGLVLKASDQPDSPLHKSRVGERPKVLYNEKSRKYVMWFHLDSHDYMTAHTGVAVADRPTGPFQFVREMCPNRFDSRDMTLFKDTDGKAYLIYSSDWNKTLRIAQLTDDYLDVNGVYSHAFPEQEREAPAIFIKDGLYYMITSGCTGWEPNNALFGISHNIFSGWKLIGDPCTGENARQTYFGQSTYVFEKDGRHYLMLDHWNPSNLKESGYSILPVRADNGHLTVSFQEYTSL
ncbi:glycoside hydrolase family 43 protein [Merdimonas faecis]|uniref:glycoside hydrolase family 43 protein n=1 Tax=Merdimonas faecis TaxID=1653435 RepID=UPI0023F847A7|nr:glycoside hydrolase family 43 protein [Merdimonas faecis]MBS5429727.1 family 43 glycosylhydrolase [Lachnospiraceae bacterium]